MANISLPLDVCHQLQTELEALSPNQDQPGLLFLQTQINAALSSLSVAATKRARPASLDNTPRNKAPKLSNSKQNSRNDTVKRKDKKTVPEEKEDSGEEEESEEGGKSGEEEKGGEEKGSAEEEESGEEGENLKGTTGEGGTSPEIEQGASGVAGAVQATTGPVAEKVKKPVAKTWETVENLRKLSDNAKSILRNLAACSESSLAQSLLFLQDALSASNHDNSQITSLDVILKRCLTTNTKVVESKFLHMVALMQLVLWLSE